MVGAMASNKQSSKSPFLGGKRGSRKSGLEPGLSSFQQPRRVVTVGGLMEMVHSPSVHNRYGAALALADFADHDGAVAALIRCLEDESTLVRLAAIFALGLIGPRLTNPLLSEQAVINLSTFL